MLLILLKRFICLFYVFFFFSCNAIELPDLQVKEISTNKIVAGYLPNWHTNTIRLPDIDKNYNLIYLFRAAPIEIAQGKTGAVYYDFPGNKRKAANNLVSDIKYARQVQKRKIILSVGGAKHGIEFNERNQSKAFVNSIISIYNMLGGIDGIDLNTFEGDYKPNTQEMIWIGLELKRLYPNFIISAPPAPWSKRDLDFCEAMVKAGAMDYAAPQYYDGLNVKKPSYVINNIKQWVNRLGEEHVVLGLGVQQEKNYMSIDEAMYTWLAVKALYPNIRGVYNWQIMKDEEYNWIFAKNLGIIINP